MHLLDSLAHMAVIQSSVPDSGGKKPLSGTQYSIESFQYLVYLVG